MIRALGRFLGSRRGVRVRITGIATVVAGVAVLAAGLWLVRAVEGSLDGDLRVSEAADIAEVTRALREGEPPTDAELQQIIDQLGPGQAIQVISDNGAVLAASGNVEGMPPLGEGQFVRTISKEAGVAGRTGAGGVPEDVVVQGGATAPTRRVTNLPAGAFSVSSALVASGDARFTVLAASPLDGVRASVDAVEDGLAVALPVLVLAVGLLTWFLTGRALRPVEAIRAEVESITGSTLSRRVPVPDTGDEVARLARTMNAMLDRIESASLRQQQFVADASHELRSPVAAIRTELEVARHTAGPDEWPAVVDQVLVEEGRLEATIADLLVLASLDEGAPIPEAEPVDLAHVVAEAARRGGDRVRAVPAVGRPVVSGSQVQLSRAIANLVDNAVRHARSSVVVGVTVADGWSVVTVDDDGPGIPEADRERVFERFTRLDGHRSRGDGGAGLGLSLVRAIAGRHGGDVHAGVSPTGGARLVLRVPMPQRSKVATTGA